MESSEYSRKARSNWIRLGYHIHQPLRFQECHSEQVPNRIEDCLGHPESLVWEWYQKPAPRLMSTYLKPLAPSCYQIVDRTDLRTAIKCYIWQLNCQIWQLSSEKRHLWLILILIQYLKVQKTHIANHMKKPYVKLGYLNHLTIVLDNFISTIIKLWRKSRS